MCNIFNWESTLLVCFIFYFSSLCNGAADSSDEVLNQIKQAIYTVTWFFTTLPWFSSTAILLTLAWFLLSRKQAKRINKRK